MRRYAEEETYGWQTAREARVEEWAAEKADSAVEVDEEGRAYIDTGAHWWDVRCVDGRWYVTEEGDVVDGDKGHDSEPYAIGAMVELYEKELVRSDPDDDELYGYDDGDWGDE